MCLSEAVVVKARGDEVDRKGEELGVVRGLLDLAGKGRDGGWLEVAPPSFVLATTEQMEGRVPVKDSSWYL